MSLVWSNMHQCVIYISEKWTIRTLVSSNWCSRHTAEALISLKFCLESLHAVLFLQYTTKAQWKSPWKQKPLVVTPETNIIWGFFHCVRKKYSVKKTSTSQLLVTTDCLRHFQRVDEKEEEIYVKKLIGTSCETFMTVPFANNLSAWSHIMTSETFLQHLLNKQADIPIYWNECFPTHQIWIVKRTEISLATLRLRQVQSTDGFQGCY